MAPSGFAKPPVPVPVPFVLITTSSLVPWLVPLIKNIPLLSAEKSSPDKVSVCPDTFVWPVLNETSLTASKSNSTWVPSWVCFKSLLLAVNIPLLLLGVFVKLL